ncbi:hypothetical protein MMC30_004215 [Trapelia coarctata]|nr:hypothetical protein [Trapelia coarctata]
MTKTTTPEPSSTSLLPPTKTPEGWYGCFGPPIDSRANPVPLQIPCGNDTVESCCGLGDQCLSNSLCRNTNAGQTVYYGAYCTDPTYAGTECAHDCEHGLSVWCDFQLWQCSNATACDLAVATGAISTFLAPPATDLANGTIIDKVEPSTIQPQFIPTLWDRTAAAPTTTYASSSTESTTSPTTEPTTLSTTSVASSISAYNRLTSPTPTIDSSSAYGVGTSNNIATIAAGITIPVVFGLIVAALIWYKCWARRREDQRAAKKDTSSASEPWTENFAPQGDVALEAQWRLEMDGRDARHEMPGGEMRPELEGRGKPMELPAGGRFA